MDISLATELEKKLLSALFLDEGEAIPQAADVLKVRDFYRPEHRRIYQALLNLNAQGTPIDFLLVERELAGKVSHEYLAGLTRLEYTTARVEWYAKSLKEFANLRRLTEVGRYLAAAVDENFREIVSAKKLAQETYTDLTTPKESLSVTTGFFLADKFLGGGLKKSDLIILATRENTVMIFSLEMSRLQIGKRFFSA